MTSGIRSAFLSADTTAEADAVQVEAYRRMGGAGRVAVVFRLNAMVRGVTLAGIRRRHPEYRDEQIEWAWQRLRLGDDLLRTVFPDRELIDP